MTLSIRTLRTPHRKGFQLHNEHGAPVPDTYVTITSDPEALIVRTIEMTDESGKLFF